MLTVDPADPTTRRVFTIGHSNHPLETFVALLKQHGTEVVADVRSQPHSKYASHFDAPELKQSIPAAGIRYVFMGREIGGRPDGAEFYDEDGYVLYERLADSASFVEGIARLERGINQCKIALMCGEEDPSGCHRRLLIGRVLVDRGIATYHIRGDGRLQTEAELVEDELRRTRDPVQPPLFDMPEEKRWRSIRSISPREQQHSNADRHG